MAAGSALRFHAVDADACEAGVQSTHGDCPFAANTRDGNAGHTLDGFRQVGVGEIGEVFGLDDVDDTVLQSLFVERAFQAGPVAGDGMPEGPTL